jgi:hypothetical protein
VLLPARLDPACSGARAARSDAAKCSKYIALEAASYRVAPLSVETHGLLGQACVDLLCKIGEEALCVALCLFG